MIRVRLKPNQGIKVGLKTVYLYDESLITDQVNKAKEWAIKTDGKVQEEGVDIDYSSKHYAGLSKESEANAKASEQNAKASELIAVEAASNADADADNAAESAGLAYQSEVKAKESELKATQEANASAESAYQSQQSALASYEYASNAEADAQNANEALDHVLVSEEKARIWADGNDTEVEPLGGTHSAIVSAGLAYAYAVAPEDVPVEEWASKHNLFVQGERGEQGEKGDATYANKGVVLLRADGWDNTTKAQSVLLQGVKMDSILWVTPAFGYYDVYVNSAVRGVSQSVNTITFACNKIPAVDIEVGVIIA